MNFYTVRKNTYYLNRQGYDAFEPVPMTQAEAEHVATIARGVVEVWHVESVRAYEMPEPKVPFLEIGECQT